MGDVIHTWPLVAELRRSIPAAEVAWLVEEPFLPLVAAHPCVSLAIPVATRRWRRAPLAAATRQAIRDVRDRVAEFAPEVALDPQGLLKSAVWARLAGVPRRIGFAAGVRRERLAGAMYTAAVAPPVDLRHVVDFNLALLAPLGVTPRYGEAPDARFLTAAGTRPDEAAGDTVALVPGAGAAGKTWGCERFAELARRLADTGWRPLLLWGPGEEPLARRIATDSGGAASVAPPSTLPELVALLRRCRGAVGGDTGPIHLAAALGIPTVAVHLTTDPERNGARGPRVHLVAGARASATRGGARTGRAREVTVAEVMEATAALLAAPE
jgi:heptosyltransferase I